MRASPGVIFAETDGLDKAVGTFSVIASRRRVLWGFVLAPADEVVRKPVLRPGIATEAWKSLEGPIAS